MTTAAKVARIGAQKPLLMQDENSGKDGRRYNEWLANRADSRLLAREAADAIADDNRSATGNTPMLIAAVCAVALPLMLVSVSALAVYLIKN